MPTTRTATTPGPWRIAPATDYPTSTALNIDAQSRGYICLAGHRGDEEAEANARLIAAAPDLALWLQKAVQLAQQQAQGGDDQPLSTAWTWLAQHGGASLAKAGIAA